MGKVKNVILIIGFSIFGGNILNAQQLVSSAGNYLEDTHAAISWSLGDVAIKTLESENIILTQGFHQSRLVVTGVRIIPGYEPDISIYPNPVVSHINVKLGSDFQAGNWKYAIYELRGKKLIENRITSDLVKISFESLPSATYFLRVSGGKSGLKVFKVVKQ